MRLPEKEVCSMKIMKRDGFKNLSLALIIGALATACGPLAPSVSKISNTAGEKTTPTDGSAPTGALGDSAVYAPAKEDLGSAGTQKTSIMTPSQYRKHSSLVRNLKPTIELEDIKLSELRTQGQTAFESNEERIKGREEALMAGKIRILSVFNVDGATLKSLTLESLQMNIKWNPSPGHWELSMIAPKTGDPAKDTNDANELMKAMNSHLLHVSIEFQGD